MILAATERELSASDSGDKSHKLPSFLLFRPMIEMCMPSVLDPTLAPPGCHVISLFTQYTPYLLAEEKQWDPRDREDYANRGTANC